MNSTANKLSILCSIGVVCNDHDTGAKNYTLSVKADNLVEAIKRLSSAVKQLEREPKTPDKNECNTILIGDAILLSAPVVDEQQHR